MQMTLDSEYRNILFCTDFSDDANFAFTHALDQCKRYHSVLHLMHVALSPEAYAGPVVDPGSYNLDVGDEILKQKMVEDQARLALRLNYEPQMKNIIQYVFAVRFGSPDVQIINYARENNIDMIVLGVVGQMGDHKGRMLKTAANVSKYAPCRIVTIGVSKK
jgi:nucleotide-binding universal stress UspA family protein